MARPERLPAGLAMTVSCTPGTEPDFAVLGPPERLFDLPNFSNAFLSDDGGAIGVNTVTPRAHGLTVGSLSVAYAVRLGSIRSVSVEYDRRGSLSNLRIPLRF